MYAITTTTEWTAPTVGQARRLVKTTADKRFHHSRGHQVCPTLRAIKQAATIASRGLIRVLELPVTDGNGHTSWFKCQPNVYIDRAGKYHRL